MKRLKTALWRSQRVTNKKLGGVGDLSRSTRLELFTLSLLLLLLLQLLRSTRFSPRLLFMSRSCRGERLRILRLLPPALLPPGVPPAPAPTPPPARLRCGGGVSTRSTERDLERDLWRLMGVRERERLRLLELQ